MCLAETFPYGVCTVFFCPVGKVHTNSMGLSTGSSHSSDTLKSGQSSLTAFRDNPASKSLCWVRKHKYNVIYLASPA